MATKLKTKPFVGQSWPPQFWGDLREEMEKCVRTAREWDWSISVDDLLEHFDMLSDRWQVVARDPNTSIAADTR